MTRPVRAYQGPVSASTAVNWSGPQELPDALVARKARGEPWKVKPAAPSRPDRLAGPHLGGEEPAEVQAEEITIKVGPPIAPRPADAAAESVGEATDSKPGPARSPKAVASTDVPQGPLNPGKKQVTVSPAHGEDYSWLRGQVEYSYLSKAWRLRYAPLGEADPYGGSLTLVGGDLHNLRDGQRVQVHGFLVPGKDDRGHPRFRVLETKPVTKGAEEDGEGK